MGRYPVKSTIFRSWHNLRLQRRDGIQARALCVLACPNQNQLTFGRCTQQPYHDPAYAGWAQGVKPILEAAFEAIHTSGSLTWIRQDLIRTLLNKFVFGQFGAPLALVGTCRSRWRSS